MRQACGSSDSLSVVLENIKYERCSLQRLRKIVYEDLWKDMRRNPTQEMEVSSITGRGSAYTKGTMDPIEYQKVTISKERYFISVWPVIP